MSIRNKILMSAIAILVISCSGMRENKADEAGLNDLVSMNSPAGSAGNFKQKDLDKSVTEQEEGKGGETPIMEKKLIKNGEVGFQVNSLSDTKQKIAAALKVNGGYIAKENSYDYSNNPTDELIVRVPAKDFDKFLTDVLNGVEKVDYKRVDIEDVTEQFVDIEARLKSKRQLENKYAELLTKATNMEDILQINKEMEIIREEIESAEGRLKYISNQVSYSTLKINYYEHKASSGFNFGGKMGNALKDGSTGFLWFLIIMVQLWPLWLMAGLVWWFIVWLIRRNRKKKQS